MSVVTRIAPTPSGYLHEGNAVNFLLVSWLAAQHGGQVVLRIDDMDAPRYRAEYVDDILGVLGWLRIGWQRGPRSSAEFESGFSMRRRTEHYRATLLRARSDGLGVYACTCSRSSLTGIPVGGCPGGCRSGRVAEEPGRTALRVHVPAGTRIDTGDGVVRLDEVLGDFVVWRRDDLPSYHLASVIEDHELGVTDIVRGVDLRESTAAQIFLAPFLGADSMAGARYLHHPLLADESGRKLSKSQAGGRGPLRRTAAHRARIRAVAAQMAPSLGITPSR